MMKCLSLILATLGPLGLCATHFGTGNNMMSRRGDSSPLAPTSTQSYYPITDNTNTHYLSKSPGSTYYPNYSGSYDWTNYLDKQDFGVSDLFNLGGSDGMEGELGGALGGVGGAVALAVGLKLLKKLGSAAIFTFIFIIVPLFLAPLVLAIAAIVLSAMNSAGDKAGDLLDLMKNRSAKRALTIWDNFFNNEECIERVSCSIGKRAYDRSVILRAIKKETSSATTPEQRIPESIDSEADNELAWERMDEAQRKTETLLGRISRAFRSNDCKTYKCSWISHYFG